MQFGLDWWIWFTVGLAFLLVLDLKLLPQRSRKHSYMIAAFWILLALAFAIVIYISKGPECALQFTTGYLIEKSLSIDNLFVFLMIFRHFHVPESWQERLLMIGIMGALVMRFAFIVVGISLVKMASWILLVFGAFLLFTGFMMLKKPDQQSIPKLTWLHKLFPKSWSHEEKQIVATISAITVSDIIFALDSIPAIFAITLDPFLVFSCNALAIIGLRSLFFILKDALQSFKNLHYGVSIILMLVGCKMLISPWYHVNTVASLAVIATVLLISMISGKHASRT